eukprot:scaffold647848_cov45-Prasinocladus_malaysianus.AAC.1
MSSPADAVSPTEAPSRSNGPENSSPSQPLSTGQDRTGQTTEGEDIIVPDADNPADADEEDSPPTESTLSKSTSLQAKAVPSKEALTDKEIMQLHERLSEELKASAE